LANILQTTQISAEISKEKYGPDDESEKEYQINRFPYSFALRLLMRWRKIYGRTQRSTLFTDKRVRKSQ
jgi:hypothetical protein